MAVIRDPNHPDFPHGTPKGRSRGCTRTCCVQAKREQVKANAKARIIRGNARCVSPEMGQRVHAHVDQLLREVPEASLDLIGKVSGVGSVPYIHFKQGRRALSLRVATAFLAVTPTKLRSAAKLVPAQPVKDRIRRLQSLGYPLAWMREKTGVHMNYIVNSDQSRIEIHVADAVDLLEELTEWRPADPDRDGILPRALSKAKHAARAAGYGDYKTREPERVMIDATDTIRRIRMMQALGYSLAWQNRQISSRADQLACAPAGTKVTPQVAEKFLALYKQIGERQADPDRDGIHPGAITYAKGAARRAGYYPPMFYDEDGTLDWRAIADHPWSIANERCHRLIEELDLALKNPDLGGRALAKLSLPDNAPDVDVESADQRFTRLLKKLRLRSIDPDRQQNRARLEDAVWRFYRRGGDPVAFALDHQLVKPEANFIPIDHPAVVDREDVAMARPTAMAKFQRKRAAQQQMEQAA